MNRRRFLALLAALPGAATDAAPALGFAGVRPGVKLVFPEDHGAHPDFRVEWWYATGFLNLPDGTRVGFQSTFFRVRTGIGEDNPSAFAPRQLIIAHAAIADPRLGRLRHDQRIARAALGFAGYSSGPGAVWLGDWRFTYDAARDRYQVVVHGEDFAYALTLVPGGPPLLNGVAGFSRKAADVRHASYYYSRPQLAVSGRLTLAGRTQPVSGQAWLDHEWSSELLPADAQGWDWVGINLEGGGALIAFRLRRADRSALWSAATWRDAQGDVRVLPPDEVAFTPGREWHSPRTGIIYPVEWTLSIEARTLRLQPLFDDQELDSRATTGSVYWEGAVTVFEDKREIGRAYLELTGYGDRIRVG